MYVCVVWWRIYWWHEDGVPSNNMTKAEKYAIAFEKLVSGKRA